MRGHYGNQARSYGRGFYRTTSIGADVVRVPVIDDSGRRTLLNVLWDADRENISGHPPSFYGPTGIYLFDHPSGEIVIEGRRFVPYKSPFPAVWEGTEGDTNRPDGTRVGISLFHTVGDRDRAVEQINTEFKSLVNELIGRMGADPTAMIIDNATIARDPIGWGRRAAAALAMMQASPLYPVWRDTVSPTYTEWNRFYNDQSSWQEWLTNWEEYEHWLDRLNSVRSAVEREIGTLRGPAPIGLPQTLPAHVAEAAAKGAGDVWQMVKIGIYGVLGLGGVIALSSVVQNLRKGQDPAEKYLALARGRR